MLIGRLQRKVLLLLSAIVVLPMVVAGWGAAELVSTNFEQRLHRWILDSARVNQSWLQAYQNDAVMVGRVLADDSQYVRALASDPEHAMPASVRRIAQEQGLSLIQVYDREMNLLYTSIPLHMQALWEPGQREAVLKVVRRDKSMLAAVGIIDVPRQGTPKYFLVLGSLIGEDFVQEVVELTGLKTRLYYREGKRYVDIFSGKAQPAALEGSRNTPIAVLEKRTKPIYDPYAEGGRYRGVYTPIVDTTGHVEAIMFSGLERGGVYDLLTNRVLLFGVIALLGIILAIGAGFLVSRMLVRPINQLRNAVLQLAGENFNTSVPIRSNDEFGDLARAVNGMATRLREARDAQAQRYQRDKLAALGELSAALAHEIRNPLGVINASAALLDKARDDPARQAELTRMIRNEAMSVSNLVQDFLHLSRHRQPALRPVDPVGPLEQALQTVAATHPASNVAVEREFDHNGAQVLADGGLLAQAWNNILTNAYEAMNGSGTLTLSSRVQNETVVLSVQDSGPGIGAELLPRLFEPFFTTKEKGTGLGLAIAHSLVEASGGQLNANPPGDGGACFTLRFPRYPESSS